MTLLSLVYVTRIRTYMIIFRFMTFYLLSVIFLELNGKFKYKMFSAVSVVNTEIEECFFQCWNPLC
jgi:hypothetical protein